MLFLRIYNDIYHLEHFLSLPNQRNILNLLRLVSILILQKVEINTDVKRDES